MSCAAVNPRHGAHLGYRRDYLRRLAVAGGALCALGLAGVGLGALAPWRWIVPAFIGPLGLFMALVGLALIIRACVVDTSTLRVADGAAFEPVSPAEALAAATPAFRDFCRRNGFELVGYRLRTPEPVVIVMAREVAPQPREESSWRRT